MAQTDNLKTLNAAFFKVKIEEALISFQLQERALYICILLANVSKLVPNELTNISKRFTVG